MNKFPSMLGKYDSKSNATSVPDGSVILSAKRDLPEGMRKVMAEDHLHKLFQEIAPLATIEGVILGHFKGAIFSGDGVYALSSTRANVFDETATPQWNALETLSGGTVTVNLLSIVPVSVTQIQLEEALCRYF